jgi:type VI secretion system protein ImpF
MARTDPDKAIVASVLDRLLDDDPEVKSEPPRAARPVLRELRASVCRDLEDLLNTRLRPLSWPEELTELDRSLLAYGIPDMTGANLASPRAREEFLRLVEAVIRRCETRFKSVKVVALETGEPLDRTLRFRVEALLHADPAPEPVVFDSTLEPVTRSFEVQA